MTLSSPKAVQPCSTRSRLDCRRADAVGITPAPLTRRRIIQGGLAAAVGLAGSLALPELTLADHFGCRYPDGTGAPYFLDFAKLYSVKLPDGSPLDPISIIQRAYCGYFNGSFPGGKVDLGRPYRDPRSGKLHLWDGYWNQNFEGPRGYTNLMIQPQSGRAYRLYGDWLARYFERGGPRVFGAPTDDPHQAGPGVEQYFLGGGAGVAGFFRERDGAPVYVVQGSILQRYQQEVGTSGRLGAPRSNEYAWGGGARSDFANGSIIYHPGGRIEVLVGASPAPANGVCTQPGEGGVPADLAQKFRDAYAAARDLIGKPGKDRNGCVHKWGDVWTQDFFNAAGEQTNLMYQPITERVHRVYGPLLQRYFSLGGPLGRLGAPLSNVYKWNDYPWFDSTRVDFESGILSYHPERERIEPSQKGVIEMRLEEIPPPRCHNKITWNEDVVKDRQVFWMHDTRYGQEIVAAIAGWNGLGRVQFLLSEDRGSADLLFEEENECYNYTSFDFDIGEWQFRWEYEDVTRIAHYEGDQLISSRAKIKLNVCLLDHLRQQERITVIAHELGHALGLAHSFPGQLMASPLPCIGNMTTPQLIDIQIYNTIYKGSSGAEACDPVKLE